MDFVLLSKYGSLIGPSVNCGRSVEKQKSDDFWPISIVCVSAEAASKGPFERFEKQWCACLRMLRNKVPLGPLFKLWDDALCPEMGVAQKHAIIPVPIMSATSGMLKPSSKTD